MKSSLMEQAPNSSSNNSMEESDEENASNESEIHSYESNPSAKPRATVRWTRVVTLMVFAMVGITSGVVTHKVITKNEQDDFQTNFARDAQEILHAAQLKLQGIHESLATFALLYPSLSETLPYATLADFEAFAVETRQTVGASVLAYTPYLQDVASRAQWEQYAVTHQDWIVESNETEISETIWRYDVIGNPQAEAGAAPYCPVWQMSPQDTAAVNFDWNSQSLFRDSMLKVLQQGAAVMSAPVPSTQLEPLVQDDASPVSLLLQPVFTSLDEATASVVGSLTAVLPWTTLLQELLFLETSGATVVLSDSCDLATSHSFHLQGTQALYLGASDFHEAQYDSWVVQGALQDCLKVSIYPTDTVKGAFETRKAALYTVLVLMICGFCAAIFVWYDWSVERRQTTVERKASQSIAMVSQLFPGVVREQLFKSHEESAAPSQQKKKLSTDPSDTTGPSQQKKKLSTDPSDTTGGGLVQHSKKTLMNFVTDTDAKQQSHEAKPIAELFPEATVMFADIAGFTAWSSIRDPAQVFMLLESIFQAFDEIAKRRGVFKVETVGDCYVAVAGVPEYCKDHALVMATFSRECMDKFSETVTGLELTLGPDTGELAMRFGLHSGPVTAGVLRGDRARFQLFGDTVNTASRIESTGMRDRIHLSEQTASLLLAAGKSAWVESREDKVEAKGKGRMTTFWLKTNAALLAAAQEKQQTEALNKSSITPETTNSISRGSISAFTPKKETQATKNRRMERLIEWNSELLIQLLKQVVARRQALHSRRTSPAALAAMAHNMSNGMMVVQEVSEIISMPDFEAVNTKQTIALPEKVVSQLQQYVSVIASMYRENPFHSFEHASHVTMSVHKLLSRIVAPQIQEEKTAVSENSTSPDELLHDHTYGITSDPLTQFSVVLAALIHDVDHRGVPNAQLSVEDGNLAAAYGHKSVAEQNSVDLAWNALMSTGFEDLRECIFADISELRRFRKLLVNSVMATDIFDKELGTARKERWEKAFDPKRQHESTATNRKATIVIEHLIQASDVAHTMQHWHVYQKWNERLFQEMYEAFLSGRSDKDPSLTWYQGEIGFFDHYVIPLAKKLKDCGVFGVASDEYLNYATENRREWANRGEENVQKILEKTKAKVQRDHPTKQPVHVAFSSIASNVQD